MLSKNEQSLKPPPRNHGTKTARDPNLHWFPAGFLFFTIYHTIFVELEEVLSRGPSRHVHDARVFRQKIGAWRRLGNMEANHLYSGSRFGVFKYGNIASWFRKDEIKRCLLEVKCSVGFKQRLVDIWKTFSLWLQQMLSIYIHSRDGPSLN